MSAVPADWKVAAVRITPGFEVSGDPYMGVTGDFDGMGISCGALQWNIGQGSLQPLVKKAGKAAILAAMPVYAEAMWTACNGGVKAGLAIVRGWQNGVTLKPAVKKELRAAMGSTAMRAQQDAEIDVIAKRAMAGAEKWVARRGSGSVSKRLFCWFFDIVTQNGNLESLTYEQVKAFIDLNGAARADDVVCDFLAGMTGASGHVKDANKNADLWRNKATGEKLEILVMSYLRAKTAKKAYWHVVINRKGAIAMGGGWVNSTRYDFASYGL